MRVNAIFGRLPGENGGLRERTNGTPLLDVTTDFAVKFQVEARAWRLDGASQSSAHQFAKLAVLYCTYDLAAVSSNSREHFNQMECAKVVDVLNRIIQDERLPLTPRTR